MLCLQEVITNKDVLAMICNTIQGADGKEPPKAAVYEPKMTRSKLKEVLEMGQVCSLLLSCYVSYCLHLHVAW